MAVFKKQSRPGAGKASHGFTLVELMAATGIMIAVVLMVLTLTTNVLSSWNMSTSRLAQNFEARVALDLISRDLEAAEFHPRDMVWLQVQQEAIVGGAPTGVNINPQTRLFFFSSVTDRPSTDALGNAIAGSTCAVSYRIRYQTPFGGTTDPQFGLYRSVVDAENTFNTALNLGDYSLGSTDRTLSALWADGATDNDGAGLTLSYVDQGGVTSTGADTWSMSAENYLSANVVDFQVEFFYRSTTAPSPRKIIGSFVFTGQLYDANGRVNDFDRLLYADVRLTVLSDEGAEILAQGGFTSLSITWDQFKQIYGETFNRRVYIMSDQVL